MQRETTNLLKVKLNRKRGAKATRKEKMGKSSRANGRITHQGRYYILLDL